MEERRLAASGRAGDSGKFPAPKFQVHPPQGVYDLVIEPIIFYHIFRFDNDHLFASLPLL
jgi:hypothetical protein